MAEAVPAKRRVSVGTVLAITALVLSAGALTAFFVLPAKRAPQTAYITLVMGEGEIIQKVNGTDQLTGEFHRWEPDTLVVNKGDTVVLTVKNPRSNNHSFELAAYGLDSGEILGKLAAPPSGGEWTVTFVADKAGTFQFKCGISFNETVGDCDPDHSRMVGYLVVLG